MIFSTRRLLGSTLRLVGRSFEDCAQEIQEWAERLQKQVYGGIPAGFNNKTPAVLSPNSASIPGSESDGWAAALHAHALDLLLSAKGDSLTRSSSGYVREAVGADGTVLVADSTQLTGRRWDHDSVAVIGVYLAWVL